MLIQAVYSVSSQSMRSKVNDATSVVKDILGGGVSLGTAREVRGPWCVWEADYLVQAGAEIASRYARVFGGVSKKGRRRILETCAVWDWSRPAPPP